MTVEPHKPETLQEALDVIDKLRTQTLIQSERIAELEQRLEKAQRQRGSSTQWLRRALRYIVAASPFAYRAQASEVLKTGLFDREHYLAQFKDRKDFKMARRNPVRHYLAVGGFEGLDPSAEFDSDWYRINNPDVAAAGVNPLVHYVRYGQQEGRLPRHGAVNTAIGGVPTSGSAFGRKLWAGFPHLALPELETLADAGLNSRAAWYLAGWYYAQGELEAALERVEQSIANSPNGATRRTLIGLAKCYIALGEVEGLESVLTAPDADRQFGSAYPYLYATMVNMQSRWNVWSTAINEVFYRVGLTGIAIRDDDRGPALNNLIGDQSREGLEAEDSDSLPLISVIVPAYNASSTLPIALDSLLAQSWPALEIIVVDDGSDDNTVEVAQAYAARDNRVRCLPNSTNVGAYATRNNGMRAARGEFLTVHDSDDWSHPQKLERQLLPLMHDSEKVATFSSWVRVTDDMRFVGPWLLSENFVEKNHSSAVIRRSVLDEIGYWDEVNVAGDTEFLWRLEHHFNHRNIVHVLPSTPLSFALADDSSLTRAKATHVKTIHYGLRRVYREAARWWHHHCEGKPVLTTRSPNEGEQQVSLSRPFPIPLGIARGTPREFDAVLVGDFTHDGEASSTNLNALSQLVSNGSIVCLFHWPSYIGWHAAPIANEIFEFCHRHGLYFAHMGLTIQSKKVVMADAGLWLNPPSCAVQVKGLQQVETLDGELVEPQSEVLEYFLQGGVESIY